MGHFDTEIGLKNLAGQFLFSKLNGHALKKLELVGLDEILGVMIE